MVWPTRAAAPAPRATGRSGPRDHLLAAVSYVQTWVVPGPGWLPTYPPTNQMVLPTTTPSAWVNGSGMAATPDQALVAGLYTYAPAWALKWPGDTWPWNPPSTYSLPLT